MNLLCKTRVWDNGDMTSCGESIVHDGRCSKHCLDRYRAEIKVELKFINSRVGVSILVDMGPDLRQQYGPYLLTEVADVDALVGYVSREVRAAGLAILAKIGAEICEETEK